MTVAHAQTFVIPKPLFSGIPISRRRPNCVSFRQFTDIKISKPLFSGIPISRRPPYCVYSHQFTDDKNDKFAFLDTLGYSPWPYINPSRYEVFIKKSYLKGDAPEQEKMDFYLELATSAVGSISEEIAKERIYKVSRDCSFCAFGFEMCHYIASYFTRNYDSVEMVDKESTGLEYYNGELIKWSLKPKREKGRFPIPSPTLPL